MTVVSVTKQKQTFKTEETDLHLEDLRFFLVFISLLLAAINTSKAFRLKKNVALQEIVD